MMVIVEEVEPRFLRPSETQRPHGVFRVLFLRIDRYQIVWSQECEADAVYDMVRGKIQGTGKVNAKRTRYTKANTEEP